MNQTFWPTTTIHLILMMTSAQVVKTSAITTDNSPYQDNTHPDNKTTLSRVSHGLPSFTVYFFLCIPKFNYFPAVCK